MAKEPTRDDLMEAYMEGWRRGAGCTGSLTRLMAEGALHPRYAKVQDIGFDQGQKCYAHEKAMLKGVAQLLGEEDQS